MTTPDLQLRLMIEDLLKKWDATGLPSRSALINHGEKLLEWKKSNGATGIWESSPLIVTSTLDDGMGHGLELIHLFSEAAGLRVNFIGLLQPPEKILSKCNKLLPDLLGLTVLQFDSEDALLQIRENLPPETRMVVGGPVFNSDPEIALRTKVHFTAKTVASYMKILLGIKFR